MEHDQALALLEEHHTFPGPFHFRVIVEPEAVKRAEQAIAEVFASDAVAREERWSRTRKYCALHLTYRADTAEQVLKAFEVIGTVDGVRVQL